MSTVPEVLQARTFGMKVLGISMISNLATDLQTGTLDHAEVMDMGNQVAGKIVTLLEGIIGDLPDS